MIAAKRETKTGARKARRVTSEAKRHEQRVKGLAASMTSKAAKRFLRRTFISLG